MGHAMFDPRDVKVLEHGHNTQELFSLIGECFADPSFRKLFGRSMTSMPGDVWLVWIKEERLDDGYLVGRCIRGFAALRLKPRKKAELCHAWTLPTSRRKGFNTWSVSRRIELARERGIKTLHTIVKPTRAAHYEALGFTLHAQRGQYTTYELRLA